ncbi:CoxF [Methylocystis sp. 9N]|uniref:CoxF n=1 Tax=Methylocystis borbori TaxID=3118750 RepID=A0ABU7XJI2_9HYPH
MATKMNEAARRTQAGGSAKTAKGVVLTAEQQSSRRARNVAIGVTIGLLVILFYAVTVVKFGGAILNRTI